MKHIFIYLFISSTLFAQVSQISMLTEACENHHATACYELGLLHEAGIGVESNQTKAKIYYTQACESNVNEACHALDKERGKNDKK